jgi:hypothetical protein
MGNPDDSTQLVIEELALSEAEAHERIADLEADNRALRDTLHMAVTMLRRTNGQLDRAKRTILNLHQTLRDARELAHRSQAA